MSTFFEQVDRYVEQHPMLSEILRVWSEVDPIYEEAARTLALCQFLNSQAHVTLSNSTQAEQSTIFREVV